jgi:hypothetical protein
MGGRWSSDKYVGTTCLRATGILARLIWRTESSLDRGLVLVCRVSFVRSRECIPVVAQSVFRFHKGNKLE